MRRSGVGALCVVGLLAAGCSTASSSPAGSVRTTVATTATTTTTTAPPPSPQSLLLTLQELPPGWATSNSIGGPSTSCYSDPVDKVPSVAYAHVDFAQGGDVPVLAEEIGLFASAAAAYRQIDDILNACHSFTETAGSTTVSGTLSPTSTLSFGQQSAAWTASISDDGIDINQGFILAQKGPYLVLVALGDTGPVDTPTLDGFMDQAIAKVPS